MALLLAGTALAGLHGSEAQAENWTGAVSTDWATSGNWSTNAVPTAATDAVIPASSPHAAEINGFAGSAKDVYLLNDGALAIKALGSLSAAGVSVGQGGAGISSLSLDGQSTLGITFSLAVGYFSTGTLTIAGGSTASSFDGYVGVQPAVAGTVTITGAGSTWLTADQLQVGYHGQGTLLIQNGGSVTVGTYLSLGYLADGAGTVTVNGAGASLSASAFAIGALGAGTLSVLNGATVSGANLVSATLGQSFGGTGTGIVSGAGSAMNLTGALFVGDAGTGSLTVSAGGAVNSSSGALGWSSVGAGTVLVTGAGSTWVSPGAVTIGNGGSGTLTIADGANVSVSSLVIASQANSHGTLNIGSGGAPGVVTAGSVGFGAGTGVINFNHTDANYTFAQAISGNGTINHLAGVTKLTGNSAGFTGTTNVNGGKLSVAGVLGSLVNVNAGGTLGGNGQIEGVAVNAGGVLSPGNSIGTLNVVGTTFNPGSTYTVELNDGGNTPGVNNDRILATGAVTINGGTVHVRPVNGTDTGQTYAVGTVYNIINAQGGVTGTFASVVDDYAYLDFKLSYDPQNVFLTSQLAATTFCLSGMTLNQCAAGNGVFSLGAGSLYSAVLNLAKADAPGALGQLSGEIHASARSALIEDSHFVRDAAFNRIRSAFDSVAAGGMPMFAYASAGPVPAQAGADGIVVWGQAFGAFGHINSDGNAARLGRRNGGIVIGADGQLGDRWRLGVFGGYSHSRFEADAVSSSFSSGNYHAGAYGGGEWGALGVRYGAAYSWHDLTSTRSIAFTGFSDHLAAGYRAGTAQVFGEAGYRIAAAGARFEPFANLAYVNLRTNGFSETGGVAALVAGGQTTSTAFSTLGLRAETALASGPWPTTLRGSLGWRHAYGDVVPASLMNFAAGGTAFTIAGVPIARNALATEAGIDMPLTPSAALGLAYGGQFGSGVTDQSVKANLAVKF